MVHTDNNYIDTTSNKFDDIALYLFIQAVLNSGHSINISSQPAWQNSGNGGVSVFQGRITR